VWRSAREMTGPSINGSRFVLSKVRPTLWWNQTLPGPLVGTVDIAIRTVRSKLSRQISSEPEDVGTVVNADDVDYLLKVVYFVHDPVRPSPGRPEPGELSL